MYLKRTVHTICIALIRAIQQCGNTGCQKDSSNNQINALVLNPLIRVCEQGFTFNSCSSLLTSSLNWLPLSFESLLCFLAHDVPVLHGEVEAFVRVSLARLCSRCFWSRSSRLHSWDSSVFPLISFITVRSVLKKLQKGNCTCESVLSSEATMPACARSTWWFVLDVHQKSRCRRD